MSDIHNYCVILAGGKGSRFWPISRESRPKQFLDFTREGKSFLRMTFDRMSEIVPPENVIVITLNKYKDLVRAQIPELPDANLLEEIHNRDTAPAVTYATYSILKRDPDAVIVTTPSDHIIGNQKEFRKTVQSALKVASEKDALITLGVMPTRPDPNFGYIQAVGNFSKEDPIKVKTFTEKPSTTMAKVLIDSGEFLWNSGIFIWKARLIKKELETLAPEITAIWAGWEEHLGNESEKEFVQSVYGSNLPRVAIDYAVMEKTDKAWVIPARFSWADIGNWESLYKYISQHDSNGNASYITGQSLMKDCSDNIFYSGHPKRLTAIRGLEDFILIDTDDVLLICPRDENKFKEFLSELAMPDFNGYK